MRPNDPTLPLFVYGIFHRGEIAWLRLRDRVDSAQPDWRLAGELRERDGLATLDMNGPGEVDGWLLVFHGDAVAAAYESIADLEPEHQYRWAEVTAVRDGDEQQVNVLAGRRPRAGSTMLEDPWAGGTDPLLSVGLHVVAEMAGAVGDPSPDEVRPLLRLQAAYLLLFTAIEHYASQSYGLQGGDITSKLAHAASEPTFAAALATHVTDGDVVRRADRPDAKARLDPHDPVRSMGYYYQLRSTISHRGKAAVGDFDQLSRATASLLAIFREVFTTAFADAAPT